MIIGSSETLIGWITATYFLINLKDNRIIEFHLFGSAILSKLKLEARSEFNAPPKLNDMQTEHQIKYQTTIKAPLEKVWDALINPDMVRQYFFGSNQETTWEVGSPLRWTGEYEGQTYVDKGVVLEFTPHKKVSYSYLSSWSGLEDSPGNYLFVTYEIEPTDSGTELTITQSNYDKEKAKHSAENWAVVIDGMKKLIE